MTSSHARRISLGASLKQTFSRRAHLRAERRTAAHLVQMSDHLLRDIGLTRRDVANLQFSPGVPLDVRSSPFKRGDAPVISSLYRHASLTAALRRALSWPARVGAARRTLAQLSRMSDYELRDIGLTRQDVADTTALPLDADPSALLVRRRAGRERPSPARSELAA